MKKLRINNSLLTYKSDNLIATYLIDRTYQILVIDEKLENAAQFELLFKEFDIKIDSISDFFEYVQVSDLLPDLILMHFDASSTKSAELFKYIKAFNLTRHIPIIVYFNEITDEYIDVITELGCFDFLEFPINSKVNYLKLSARIQDNIEYKSVIEQVNSLKELNTIKDKFLSIIAHDLKSPFSSLIGFSELLIDDFEVMTRDDIKMYHNIIYSAAKQGWLLLENLLQWTRAQTGRLEVNPQIINLNEFVTEAKFLLSLDADNKRIEIIANISTETECIIADPNIIRTVFRNLLSNAIKFSHANSKVYIETELIDNFIHISIIDNGLGIKAENLNKLFKLDIHHSTLGTANEKGTGLGLIITKDFVEKSGGKIWVESVFGKGSKFTFSMAKAD